MDRRTDSPAVRRQLAALLRQQIEDGQYEPGDTLPSANALAKEHGVHTGTAHAALDILAAEGMVIRIQRVGTVVSGEQPVHVEYVEGAAQIAARMPTAEERRDMDIPSGVPLLTVTRQAEGEVEVAQFLADRTVLECGT